ncbi:hypothetical protein K2173_003002 [Erythroxylum novogranatense]|uniref:Uncharacterized protein n=1 Tax=Erythroxylum novogranatense TaxID=1862640 RepID=A0AAV8S8K0_9ROSI|nr:hypothetical protein K2173_003002 [Erythroxylum novogranatense]
MNTPDSVDNEIQEIRAHGYSTMKVATAKNIRRVDIWELRGLAHNYLMMKMAVAHNTTAYKQDKDVGTGENRVSICKEMMQDRNFGTKNSEGGLQSKTTNMGTSGVSKGGTDKEIGDEESSTSNEEVDNMDMESADTEALDHPENEELVPKVFDKMSDPIYSGTLEVKTKPSYVSLFRNDRELKQGM